MTDVLARLFVLCGLPGSGKTTLGRRLERDHGVIRLCPDDWLRDLGLTGGGWEARGAVERVQKRLARDLLRHGVDVAVEDGFWLREQRDAMRSLAHSSGARPVVVFLEAPIDDLWERIDRRNRRRDRHAFDVSRQQLEDWSRGLEAPGADEPDIVTPDGLDDVLARLSTRARSTNS